MLFYLSVAGFGCMRLIYCTNLKFLWWDCWFLSLLPGDFFLFLKFLGGETCCFWIEKVT